MKTTYRPSHRWRHWEPSAGVVLSIIDVAVSALGDDHVELAVSRSSRDDIAETADEARQLATVLDDDDVSAVALDIRDGAYERSVRMEASVGSAYLATKGASELATRELLERLISVMEAGARPAPSDTYSSELGSRAALERTVKLRMKVPPLALTAGELANVVSRIDDLVGQLGGKSDRSRAIVTDSRQATTTVNDMAHLGSALRPPHSWPRRLWASLGSSIEGVRATVHFDNSFVGGASVTVEGPDEPAARTLKGAVADILSEEAGWMRFAQPYVLLPVGVVLWGGGMALVALAEFALGLAVVLPGALLLNYTLFVPRFELLPDGGRPRSVRWGRWVLSIVVAWVVGCLAVPLL